MYECTPESRKLNFCSLRRFLHGYCDCLHGNRIWRIGFNSCLFPFFSRAKLQDTLADAQEKLTREQSRSAEALIRHAEKQKSPAKPPIDSSKTNKELLELRRANAHLKDEIKQLKQSLREAEQRLKEADERVELSLFKVRAENSALLEKLKDLEQNSPDKKKALALEQELREWQNRSRELERIERDKQRSETRAAAAGAQQETY